MILWLEIRRACARQEGNKEIKNLVTGTPGRGKKAFRTRSRDIASYRFPLPSLEYTTNPLESIPLLRSRSFAPRYFRCVHNTIYFILCERISRLRFVSRVRSITARETGKNGIGIGTGRGGSELFGNKDVIRIPLPLSRVYT